MNDSKPPAANVKKTRLSLAQGKVDILQSNNTSKPSSTNYLAKGMKMIENAFKRDAQIVGSDNDNSKNLFTSKSKPLTGNTVSTTETRANVLRVSNRRKSTASGSIKPELWKDL